MKKISKAKTIVRAFTQDSDIDPIILEKRRSICSICPHNSENTDQKELGLIDKARKKLLKDEPFCIACGCQINEKTTQETEECGLAEKGLPPKWNRVKIETVDKIEIDIINKSPEIINMDLSKDDKFFVFDFGEINKEDNQSFEVILKTKDNYTLEVKYFTPSCNSCTSSTCERIDSFSYSAKVKLNTDKLSGKFAKNIYFAYTVRGKYKKNRIKMIGIVK